jgi:hypothetical protein
MERPRPQPNPEKRTLEQLREHMRSVKIPGTRGKEAAVVDERLIVKMRTEISDQQIDEAMKGWLPKGNETPRG